MKSPFILEIVEPFLRILDSPYQVASSTVSHYLHLFTFSPHRQKWICAVSNKNVYPAQLFLSSLSHQTDSLPESLAANSQTCQNWDSTRKQQNKKGTVKTFNSLSWSSVSSSQKDPTYMSPLCFWIFAYVSSLHSIIDILMCACLDECAHVAWVRMTVWYRHATLWFVQIVAGKEK